jgi:acetolactate synthase-1/2/3 large subunit
MMPENAIISDEAITSSRGADEWTAVSPPHDWLSLAGGAIGQGMPLSVGAAVACPDRKVFAMQADGSAMYTVQALWTQAREQLDVITVLFSNRAYAILQHELRNVGAAAGPKAQEMLNLDNPTINWAQIANGMGVNASRAETAEAFTDQLAAAIYNKGPHLIEAII